MQANAKYRIGIDIGGTFTDLLMVNASGKLLRGKTLSTPPEYDEGVINGLTRLAEMEGVDLGHLLSNTDLLVHGTTVATNTVLTGTGARTVLFTTEGFRDALAMRRGVKEKIYDNKDIPPDDLISRRRRLGIRERVMYNGALSEVLDRSELQGAVRTAEAENAEAIAICFLNSYANGDNESMAAEITKSQLPELFVTASSEFMPRVGFYDRLSTTVLNAYTGPGLGTYLASLNTRLGRSGFEGSFLVMLSAGGVTGVESASETPVAAVRSGPAGCTVAAAHYAKSRSLDHVVSFDMGGTSLDVASVVEGEVSIVQNADFNRYRISVPMVDLVSIGAGGGSIAWLDSGGLLHVGPETSGANPGPACYGRGGQRPTVTDADLILGYIDPDSLLGGDVGLRVDAALAAVEQEVAVPLGMQTEDAAAAIYEVVNVNMATALREYLHERGQDPRDFTVVVAGGAGPIHAAPIAQELGIAEVVIPRDAPILSAAGLLIADLRHDMVQTHFTPLDEIDFPGLIEVYKSLENQGRDLLETEGVERPDQRVTYAADLRYERQINDLEVSVSIADLKAENRDVLAQSFHDKHKDAFGYSVPGSQIEFVNAKVAATGATPAVEFAELPELPPVTHDRIRTVRLPGASNGTEVAIYKGAELGPGSSIEGPAIVETDMTSILVIPEWTLRVDSVGNLLMTKVQLA